MTNDNASKFGQWLRQKHLELQVKEGRKILDIEFGVLLGLSKQNISHYMSGRYLPTEDKLDRIASVLGNEAYLIAGLVPPDPEIIKLLRRLEQLDDRTRTMAIEKMLSVLDNI